MTTPNSTEANKTLVLEGLTGVFIERDLAVIDRLFSPDYRQHNPQIPNGLAAISPGRPLSATLKPTAPAQEYSGGNAYV